MSHIFFRFYLVFFALVTQSFFAQNYPDGMSDATLKVNSASVPVKVYSTTELGDLNVFPDRKVTGNVLVILNESNFEPAYFNFSALTLAKFKEAKYQFLDKNFKPVEAAPTKENIKNFKYAVKTDRPVTAGDSVNLETTYKIWTLRKESSWGLLRCIFTA